MSREDPCAASLPDLRAPTRWGMQRVAASDVQSFLKLAKITWIVFKTSSFVIPVDHNSLSRAAATRDP